VADLNSFHCLNQPLLGAKKMAVGTFIENRGVSVSWTVWRNAVGGRPGGW
jgi:hypothetical protein